MHSYAVIAALTLKIIKSRLVPAITISKDVIEGLWMNSEWM